MLMLMLPIRRHFEPARSVSDKEKVALETLPSLVLEAIAPQTFPSRCESKIAQRRIWKLAKKSIEHRSTKISQPMCVESCSKRNLEVGEEVHRRSLHENFQADVRIENSSKKIFEVCEEVHRTSLHKNFPTDLRRELLEEKFGSWRISSSNIAPRKFPNRFVGELPSSRNGVWSMELRRTSWTSRAALKSSPR